MNTGSLLWLVVFGITAFVFFGVAAIVTVKGFQDLMELFRRGSDEKEETESGKNLR